MLVPRHVFSRLDSPVVRLGAVADNPAEQEPAAIVAARPTGSRRPHTDRAVANVRRLIETTTLTYSKISAKTGVGRASISRWARDGAWTRPFDAPRSTDRMPTARAGQKRKLRLLSERLRMLAERYVRELEETPGVDLDKLVQALQVLKMARLEAQGRRRRRRRVDSEPHTGLQLMARENAIRTAIKEMRRGGVDLDRTPQEAVDLLIEARTPLEEHPALRPTGRGKK